jgi:hypothetical protein
VQAATRMKVIRAARAALLVSVTAAACRSRPQDSVIAPGRGAISNTQAMTVIAVATASEAMDYDGKNVQAGPDHNYVVLHCRFAVAPNQVYFDDFQLVRDRVAKVGQEANLGDNRDGDYFYWTFLDTSGRPTAELPASTSPFEARLAFKVPSGEQGGYLSYWGLYWGPLQFEGSSR